MMPDKQMSPMQMAMAMLMTSYHWAKVPPGTAKSYASCLDDIEPSQLLLAIKDIVQTSKFFPAVSEIRDRVEELFNPSPSGIAAWGEYLAYRIKDTPEKIALQQAPGSLVPAIIEVIDKTCPEVRDRAFPNSSMASARARFIEHWDQITRDENAAKRRVALGINPPAPASRKLIDILEQ